jgi:hypothetical protein
MVTVILGIFPYKRTPKVHSRLKAYNQASPKGHKKKYHGYRGSYVVAYDVDVPEFRRQIGAVSVQPVAGEKKHSREEFEV